MHLHEKRTKNKPIILVQPKTYTAFTAKIGFIAIFIFDVASLQITRTSILLFSAMFSEL